MTSVFPWDYKVSLQHKDIAGSMTSCVILIGLGKVIPADIEVSDTTYLLYIDPNLKPEPPSLVYGILPTDWGDVLRLPNNSSQSQDHPFIIALRSLECTWIGNADQFETVFDLMVAASYHQNSSKYLLAKNGTIVANNNGYHPMSGKLPNLLLFDHQTQLKLLSLILGFVYTYKKLSETEYKESKPLILLNQHSSFSLNTSTMILLISYFGIDMNGDGTLQEKSDNYQEFRQTLFMFLYDVVMSYAKELKVSDIFNLTAKLCEYFKYTPKE